MADLHNPLFEDEKEFLERQKLEYERALLGDVEDIKQQTQRLGKYALIGAGLAGGLWLIARTLRSKPRYALEEDDDYGDDDHPRIDAQAPAEQAFRHPGSAPVARPAVDEAIADDLGFGAGHHQLDRGEQRGYHRAAQLAPDVYHTDAEQDPFQPVSYAPARTAARRPTPPPPPPAPDSATSIVADAFHVFLQSDTGKMLVAQISAVLMAYVAKKVGEYFPSDKNADLAASVPPSPATHDIDFTYHHDDANAPHQPA